MLSWGEWMDKQFQELGLRNISKALDRRLRRLLLTAIFEARVTPSGWVGATTLHLMVNSESPEGMQFQNEVHCIGLLRDLTIKGLIEERQKDRLLNEPFGLKHLEYRMRSQGLSLHLESAPPDPDIDDDRI
jgi:hypothetical protein